VRQVPAPGAGAEWSVRPDRGELWVVRAALFRFTTDATVTARAPRLVATDGTTTWFRTGGGEQQLAGQQRIFCAFDGGPASPNVGDHVNVAWPVGGLYLPAGFTLGSTTFGIQPADQIDQIALLVEEWMSGWRVDTQRSPFEYQYPAAG
jgi:hypothetical protein